MPAPIDLPRAVELIDARVIDAGGHRLGRVAAVLADRDGTPWWFVLRRRRHEVLAPVAAAFPTHHGELILEYSRADLENAPQPEDSDHLTAERHDAMVAHFGLPRTPSGRFTRA